MTAGETGRMSAEIEAEVLRTLEAALAQPEASRLAWLAAQPLAPAVSVRVRALLEREAKLGGFLDEPVALEATLLRPAPGAGGGERVGAWRILRELDAGGMGVVFLGERADGTYEQQVAIKFMQVPPLASARERAEFAARFDNERRLLARIEHPNVARILDGGATDEGVPYLVMEYVDGAPLTRWCDQQRLGVRERIRLFARVCDGVQAAHQHLIVHRDLKPGNILVDRDGEPRLLDFGIARKLDPEASGGDAPTLVGAMTPAYASPEQVRREPLTTASDVYSLGIVLYELLSGQRPYSLKGLSPAQSERVVCTTDPPTLRRAIASSPLPQREQRARIAGIGTDLERIVARSLHKEPVRRYESARALADDLRRWLDGRPVEAHPDSAGYRAMRFVDRHRLGTALAALALAAVLGAAALALVQAHEARRAAADTELVNSFLLDVINASNTYREGEEVTLGDALDAAAGSIEERFGDRPDLAFPLHLAIGESLWSRDRYDAAERQLERARELGERLRGKDDAEVVRTLIALAAVHSARHEAAKARVLYAEVLLRLERLGETRSQDYINTLNNIGVNLSTEEDYAGAREYLARALDAMRPITPENEEDAIGVMINLAAMERNLGHYAAAEALFAEVQPILDRLYPQGGVRQGLTLVVRARLASLQGRHREAMELGQRGLAMQEEVFKGDHSMVLAALTNLADIGLKAADIELAERSAEAAVAMAARLYPQRSHPSQVNALAALAGVRLVQERQTDAAILLERARTLMQQIDSTPRSTRERIDQLVELLCHAGTNVPAALCGASGRASPAGVPTSS